MTKAKALELIDEMELILLLAPKENICSGKELRVYSKIRKLNKALNNFVKEK